MAQASPIPTVDPVTLTGERLALRDVVNTDVSAAFRWGSDPEFFRFLPFEAVTTMEEEQVFIDEVIASTKLRPRLDYHLAVERLNLGEVIGMVRLRVTSTDHRNAALGYGIRPDLWGQGFGLEVADLMVDFGFRTLGLHRISAGHHPDNLASGRILQRLGMTREGQLRQNLLAHGRWRDSVIYGILEDEWRNPNEK